MPTGWQGDETGKPRVARRCLRIGLHHHSVFARLLAAPGGGSAAPIYGVTIPEGYRSWGPIAPALEDAPLDELRVEALWARGVYRANSAHQQKTRYIPRR